MSQTLPGRNPIKVSLLIAASLALACPTVQAKPLRDWPDVARGEQPVNVRALQFLLRAEGYRVSTDGSFGRRTETALRQFQHAHQLVASGETNDPTWEALLPSLHQGSHGPAVQAAQVELRDAGYAVAVDGVFGPRMKAVVQKYQKRTGHTADGVIGHNTWYELFGGNTSGDD